MMMKKYCRVVLLMLLFLVPVTIYADSIPEFSSIMELEGKTVGYNGDYRRGTGHAPGHAGASDSCCHPGSDRSQ